MTEDHVASPEAPPSLKKHLAALADHAWGLILARRTETPPGKRRQKQAGRCPLSGCRGQLVPDPGYEFPANKQGKQREIPDGSTVMRCTSLTRDETDLEGKTKTITLRRGCGARLVVHPLPNEEVLIRLSRADRRRR